MKNTAGFKLVSTTAVLGAIFVLSGSALHAQTAPARNARARVSSSESVRGGTVTTDDGQTAITSIDQKWDAKTGTGTLNEAATLPDGRVFSREANLTRNPDGTITAKGTMTDFDGRPANYVETTKQTSAGPIIEGKMVDVDGKVATYETFTARIARNQIKRTTVITRPDGTRETRVEMLAPPKTTAMSD